MDTNSIVKHPFYTVYDYGMGGIWFVVLARAIGEISDKYPFLKVIEPNSFPREFELDKVQVDFIQDIDEPDIEMMAGARREWTSASA